MFSRWHLRVAALLALKMGVALQACDRHRQPEVGHATTERTNAQPLGGFCLNLAELRANSGLAQQGDADSAYRVYLHYEFCSSDGTRARQALEKAAALGHPDGLLTLGYFKQKEGDSRSARDLFVGARDAAHKRGDVAGEERAKEALSEVVPAESTPRITVTE